MVGEELEGDDGEDGDDEFRGGWNEKNVVGDAGEGLVAFRADGDDGAFPGFDFLDIAEVFFKDGILRGDEDGWGVWIDEGDDAVFEFRAGMAGGGEVGNFFEFEGGFEGDGVVCLATEEEEILGVGVFAGEGLNLRIEGKNLLDFFREAFEFANDV